MLVADPEHRILASEAMYSELLLDKNLIESLNTNNKDNESIQNDLKDFQEKYRFNIKKMKDSIKNASNQDENVSIEMRFNKYEGGSIDNSTKSFGVNSIQSGQSGNKN